MKAFSFLKKIKENSDSKNIIVSFESTIDGYEIVDKKGMLKVIGMNTEKCKLKNFEEEVKKFIRREVYKESPDINGLINLSLDFRPNEVLISGEKVIIRKINENQNNNQHKVEDSKETKNKTSKKTNNNKSINKKNNKSTSNTKQNKKANNSTPINQKQDNNKSNNKNSSTKNISKNKKNKNKKKHKKRKRKK